MRLRVRIALLTVGGVLMALPGWSRLQDSQSRGSLRSHELVDLRCQNELTRRQVTLFGNGTIRVKEGKHEDVGLRLGDLDPITLRGYTDRYRELDFSEVERNQIFPTEGDWVETCDLELDFPYGPKELMSFSRFDTLPLSLKRAVELTDELAALAEPIYQQQLPVDYDPRTGDILRHRDGSRYVVMGKTVDKKGVELQGLDSPLTLYMDSEQLRRSFGELLSRKSFF